MKMLPVNVTSIIIAIRTLKSIEISRRQQFLYKNILCLCKKRTRNSERRKNPGESHEIFLSTVFFSLCFYYRSDGGRSIFNEIPIK